MKLDYRKEAFVIAGELRNGKVQFYTYDYDNECFGWTFCIFDANFYFSSDEVYIFIRNIESEKDRCKNIKRIWVEKVAPTKCNEFPTVELNS